MNSTLRQITNAQFITIIDITGLDHACSLERIRSIDDGLVLPEDQSLFFDWCIDETLEAYFLTPISQHIGYIKFNEIHSGKRTLSSLAWPMGCCTGSASVLTTPAHPDRPWSMNKHSARDYSEFKYDKWLFAYNTHLKTKMTEKIAALFDSLGVTLVPHTVIKTLITDTTLIIASVPPMTQLGARF